MKSFKSVDDYLVGHPEHVGSLQLLRDLLNSTELEECVKWGAPCYTINGKNVIGIAAFKSYVGLWFHQGVFLKDPHKVLINAQEGTTKALRQWRFSSVKEIEPSTVLDYVKEAIDNEKAGKKVKPEKKALIIPAELQQAFEKDSKLLSRFEEMSLSCKREYAEYIAEAKKEETRLRRLDKVLPMILTGKGLNDKYR